VSFLVALVRWPAVWAAGPEKSAAGIAGRPDRYTLVFTLLPVAGFSPVSRTATLAWCAIFSAFLVNASIDTDGFLFIDNANLMIHEVGHAMFAWAGYYTQILGGTIAQILAPLTCLLFFLRRGDTTAVAATAFWGFENLLYIAAYMGDARRSAMPLVGSDESDWTILLTHWGLLQQDTVIAAWTRGIGWIGMLVTIAWLAWMHLRQDRVAGSDPGLTPV
jgi:hypothetical protein